MFQNGLNQGDGVEHPFGTAPGNHGGGSSAMLRPWSIGAKSPSIKLTASSHTLCLDERVGLLDSIEDHAEADRRTLADSPLEKTVQMSGTASSLIR